MFNKIIKYVQDFGTQKRVQDLETKSFTTSTIKDIWNNSSFSTFNREQSQKILKKLNGYQYISADIVAKTVAAQKLRLYSAKPIRRSKNHKGKEVIFVKNIPVSEHRLSYFKGEQEICHNDVSLKTLAADDSIVEVLEHPAIDMIRKPNKHSNQWQFLYTMIMAVQFFGNSYMHKVRFTDGNLAELWYIPPQNMQIIQGKTYGNFIDSYKWTGYSGTEIIYQPTDIIDLKMPGVGDSQVYGTSKVEVVWKYIGLIDSSLAFQKAVTDNTGRPDIILIAEEASAGNVKSLKRLESKWNDRFYGPNQAGKMSTVPGKVKVEVLPRADFDFDNDTSLVRAIARGFGLPEYKVLPSSAIKANDSTQEKDFMKETIDSYLTLIEEVFNQQLLSEYDDDSLFFAFDPVIKEDLEFKLKSQTQKTEAAHLTLNEVRAKDGLEPMPGGDDLRYKGKSILTMDTEPVKEEPITPDDKELTKDIVEDIAFAVKELLGSKESEKVIKEVQPLQIVVSNDTTIEEIIED